MKQLSPGKFKHYIQSLLAFNFISIACSKLFKQVLVAVSKVLAESATQARYN